MPTPTEISPLKRALIAIEELQSKSGCAARAAPDVNSIAVIGDLAAGFPGARTVRMNSGGFAARGAPGGVPEIPADRWECGRVLRSAS